MNTSPPFQFRDFVWTLILSVLGGGTVSVAIEMIARAGGYPILLGPEWAMVIGGAVGLAAGAIGYGFISWSTRRFISSLEPYIEEPFGNRSLSERLMQVGYNLQDSHRSQGRLKSILVSFMGRAEEVLHEVPPSSSDSISQRLEDLREDFQRIVPKDAGKSQEFLDQFTGGLTESLLDELNVPGSGDVVEEVTETCDKLEELQNEIGQSIGQANQLLEQMAEIFRQFPDESLPDQAENLRQHTIRWNEFREDLEPLKRDLQEVPDQLQELRNRLQSEGIKRQLKLQLQAADVTISIQEDSLSPEAYENLVDRLRRTEQTARELIRFQDAAHDLVQDLARWRDGSDEESLKVSSSVDET